MAATQHQPTDVTGPDVELQGTSTGGLVQQAVAKGSQLIAAEIQLAKQEVTESLRAAVMALVAGGIALVGAIGFLVMAIVTTVIAVQPHWLAALGFTVLFLVIAVGGGLFAMSRLKRISPLRQTTETIKEDVEWAKQQLTHDVR